MSDEQHMAQASENLGTFLKMWRERLEPTRIPGVNTSRRRLKSGLTQEEVARLTGVSLTWYRELERGARHHFSEKFLQRLAAVLRLDHTEKEILFQLSLGHPPSSVGFSADSEFRNYLQVFLDGMLPHPAYVCNLRWDVIAHNQAQCDWFPWVRYESNVVRWTLLYPEAQYQLVNWRTDWAAPLLAQLRYVLASHSSSEELKKLRDDVLGGSDEAKEIWRMGESQVHPSGDVRRLRLPHHESEEVTVRIVALSPLGAAGLRVIALLRV